MSTQAYFSNKPGLHIRQQMHASKKLLQKYHSYGTISLVVSFSNSSVFLLVGLEIERQCSLETDFLFYIESVAKRARSIVISFCRNVATGTDFQRAWVDIFNTLLLNIKVAYKVATFKHQISRQRF